MKILLYDLETSPIVGFTWGTFQQNVVKVKRHSELLSFAYQWLGEDEVHYESRQGQSSDKQLVKKLHKLLSSADVTIAHNGDNFDNKKSNTRFIKHGLKPPTPRKSIDTLKVARKHFAFTGNSLDALADYLGVGRKLKHLGIDMWDGCMDGDRASWKLMEKYNRHDIFLLHGVYLILRPWIRNHPNISERGVTACPKCGSTNLVSRGYDYSRSTVNKLYRCKDCKGAARSRLPVKSLKHTLVNG